MKKTCMLIPGNPAIADYYHSWIEEIKKTNQHMNVFYATSYVLFDRKLNYTDYDLAMRKHYEDMFLGLSSQGGTSGEKVTIIAHSVGSYFALRLLEKHPEKIERVVIMFPYIGYSTIKSLKFLPLLYWIDRVFPLSELVARFKILFWRYGKDVHSISNHELTACLRFGVRQCVYFEKHKFDINTISSTKDKLDFIYTDGDRWCPTETIELLKPISNWKKVALPHDFILKEENRLGMITEMANGSSY